MNKAEKMYEKIATSFFHKNVDLEIELDAKNKEIEDLKNRVDELECQLAYECGCNEQLCELQNKLENVRSDMCVEISEQLLMCCDWYKKTGHWYTSAESLFKVLDKIEKGE